MNYNKAKQSTVKRGNMSLNLSASELGEMTFFRILLFELRNAVLSLSL